MSPGRDRSLVVVDFDHAPAVESREVPVGQRESDPRARLLVDGPRTAPLAGGHLAGESIDRLLPVGTDQNAERDSPAAVGGDVVRLHLRECVGRELAHGHLDPFIALACCFRLAIRKFYF